MIPLYKSLVDILGKGKKNNKPFDSTPEFQTTESQGWKGCLKVIRSNITEKAAQNHVQTAFENYQGHIVHRALTLVCIYTYTHI